jgi:hypothetical protein
LRIDDRDHLLERRPIGFSCMTRASDTASPGRPVAASGIASTEIGAMRS